ncbi:unnamed protein product [Fusarium graminearum]|nr:unnamed protein product [Fusarium graminearum]
MDYEGDTIMGGMETSPPFTQQSATGLLFHLQKASTLLTNLNPQNSSTAYEEKEIQVKATIEDIYNRVVRYDMKRNEDQVQVQIYEPASSDDYDYSDEDDCSDEDDYADMPLQIPNLSAAQALAAARASAREGYEKRKNGHKNRNRVKRKKKRDKRRKRVERKRWEKRRVKKRLARMAGLRRHGKDCAFVFENMQ